MHLRIGILRTAADLVELRSVKRHAVEMSLGQAPPPTLHGELRRLYSSERVPLEGEPELRSAWAQMAQVSDWGPRFREALELVLECTHPDPRALHQPFQLVTVPARSKATAAHPRAYRGTQTQPPKPPQPPAQDLRPVLASVAGTREALAFLDRPWTGRNGSFPLSFELSLGPLLTGDEGPWLGLFWALELERRTSLREAVTRLACLDSSQLAQTWSRRLLDLAPGQRTLFLTCLLESGGYRVSPPESLAPLAHLLPKRIFGWRAFWWGSCLAAGAAPQALQAGLEVARRLGPSWSLPPVPPVAILPDRAVLDRLVAHVLTALSYNGAWLAREAWLLWIAQPALAGSQSWLRLAPEEARDLLTQLSEIPASLRIPLLEQLVLIPEGYRSKFAGEFQSTPSLRRWWERLALLMRRVCRPPFRKHSRPWEPWRPLARYLSSDQLGSFVQVPDASFICLEKACHGDCERYLIMQGMARLARDEPAFLVKAFHQYPRPLVQVVGLLGTLHADLWRQVYKRWQSHPLAGPLDDSSLLAAIQTALPRTSSHRIPSALRKGAGSAVHWQILREGLVLCRVDLLTDLCREALYQDLGLAEKSEATLHAAQLAGTVERNRHELRRFLRAVARGASPTHPENSRWLRQHPQLDATLWTQGFELVVEDVPHPPLRLYVERDPIEVLRMGTHVRSCLALGGSFSYSAAAVALDVNKQVVYARDGRNRVVGRQLLAISTAGELIPFWVYPAEAPLWLESLFRDYYSELARRLNLPVRTKDDYEVEVLAARDWWDDGAYGD